VRSAIPEEYYSASANRGDYPRNGCFLFAQSSLHTAAIPTLYRQEYLFLSFLYSAKNRIEVSVLCSSKFYTFRSARNFQISHLQDSANTTALWLVFATMNMPAPYHKNTTWVTL